LAARRPAPVSLKWLPDRQPDGELPRSIHLASGSTQQVVQNILRDREDGRETSINELVVAGQSAQECGLPMVSIIGNGRMAQEP